MLQPEEILIETLNNHDIDAWSTLDDLDGVDQVVFINRIGADVIQQAIGMGWTTVVYTIDMQCYSTGGQLSSYALLDRVFDALYDIYNVNFEVDLGIDRIGWLPPLNGLSGSTLGIQLTITRPQGE